MLQVELVVLDRQVLQEELVVMVLQEELVA